MGDYGGVLLVRCWHHIHIEGEDFGVSVVILAVTL
jgi:hypothetical protein